MKLSESWLREWVNTTIDTQTLSHQLTMAGLEVEAVHSVAHPLTGIIVAEVLSAEKHPDADRLRVCQVNPGHGEPLTVVCGAANVRAGLKVAFAQVGATLPNLTIKKAKLRGVESNGMICSAVELGIAEQSEGILELPTDAPIGKDINDYLQLNDHIIEISLTPNRGDCLSVQGIAREVAVINNKALIAPKVLNISAKHDTRLSVTLSAKAECPHYVGRIIHGINAKATTPIWMQEKLRRCGVRAISPVVDVTNFVMLELGQPMHAFDLAKIQTEIIVRHAKAGETITLLDGQTISLHENTLVIADKTKPLALAGIMGGEDSAVSDNTQHIFLESAFFTPSLLMGRARSYGLHTDSSHRFERGVDPNLQTIALERATQLLIEIVGGEVGPIIDVSHLEFLPKQPSIILRRERLNHLLGITIDDHIITGILSHLNIQVEVANNGWKVLPPSYRFDLQIEADLIEEVARIYGYENIPTISPRLHLVCNAETEKFAQLKNLKQLLIDRGYQEIISYSFVDEKIQRLLDPQQETIKLKNPISSEMAVMRTTLWGGLLQTLLYNLNRQQSRAQFFEMGLRYVLKNKEIIQEKMLAGLIAGTQYPEQWGIANQAVDFYDIKNDLLVLFEQFKIQCEFKATQHPSLHPGQAAQLSIDKEIIGIVGALHPRLAQQLEIDIPVFVFELTVEKLQQHLPVFHKISKFPALRRDLAILVDADIQADVIQKTIIQHAQWVQEITFFDVYRGKNIAENQKSIAISLILQHPERTLLDDEVNQIVSNIVEALRKELHAELRM